MEWSELNLEMGSNVFELIEFSLLRVLKDGSTRIGRYGINVAKVREVLRLPVIDPLASSIPSVSGVFELRGVPIPAIHLNVALGDPWVPLKPEQQVIVAEFAYKRAGFIVHTTKRIRRVTWDRVLPPAADKNNCLSGMIIVEGNEFLYILDLEKILIDIETQALGGDANALYRNTLRQDVQGFNSQNPYSQAPQRLRGHILLIDDSSLILNHTRGILEKAGYQVTCATDGHKGKLLLEKAMAQNQLYTCVVSDVEMPKMDGMTLTRWIRAQESLKDMPLILHTSLAGGVSQSTGLSLGANGYVLKQDSAKLMQLIQELTESTENRS